MVDQGLWTRSPTSRSAIRAFVLVLSLPVCDIERAELTFRAFLVSAHLLRVEFTL